jgi:hypothetical protein
MCFNHFEGNFAENGGGLFLMNLPLIALFFLGKEDSLL